MTPHHGSHMLNKHSTAHICSSFTMHCNVDFVTNMDAEAEENSQNRVCEDCGEIVSKKSWKRHQLRKHDTRVFQCDE